VSLRERKKQETRRRIGEVAHQLFEQRGFDAVTVASVAEAADVSEGTVFNYFPTKEDLFYTGMEAFEAELVEAVRTREPGTSVIAAFRDFIIARSVQLESPGRTELILKAAAAIDASPALRAREREVVATYTDQLAAVIADDVGAAPEDVVPYAVASAVMGVQAALSRQVRAAAVAGKSGRPLAHYARMQARAVFEQLERGLADYAVKR
jgi:AcrR family transcriptional regulator